jgi:hypothetical protein
MDYYLAPDVHACCSGDLIVFLDVRRDRYFASPRDTFELDVLGRRLCVRTEEGKGWAAKVQAQGLVCDSASNDQATASSVWLVSLPRPMAFIASLLWAARAVDTRLALSGALTALRARRAQLPHCHKKAAAETAQFVAWRPLWPRPFVCLHDTLALSWFLSARGAGCEIVFGVQGRPFAAHCWAEAEGKPLNDEPEYCSSFDVILRV